LTLLGLLMGKKEKRVKKAETIMRKGSGLYKKEEGGLKKGGWGKRRHRKGREWAKMFGGGISGQKPLAKELWGQG